MGLEEKAKAAQQLKMEYSKLYDDDDISKAIEKEKEYLKLRAEVLQEVNSNNTRQRSETMKAVKDRVSKKEKPKRRETGIRDLDINLLPKTMYNGTRKGGFALGNFIQIAGSRGTGKSSLMLKILTGLSNYEKVCWFDFEMGESRVVEKLEKYPHDDINLLYYNSSRLLNDVSDEIKLLNAAGINHFVIDSAMKIVVPGADNYNRFSTVSSELSSLTSALGINIYMINQMRQSADKDGHLAIKHGNDAEYDADYIFYFMFMVLRDSQGNKILDDENEEQLDINNRKLICEKNRQDDRLFSVVIPKSAIEGIEVEVSEYKS